MEFLKTRFQLLSKHQWAKHFICKLD